MTQATVKTTTTHDRMALVTTFANGDQFKFSITRSGESIRFAQFPKNPPITKADMKALQKMTDFRKDESNLQRFERIVAICKSAVDMADLVSKAAA